MEEDKILSVDEFFAGNGEDFFLTEAEELPSPAYLESFSIIEVE
jgi:hypothetical protein